VQEKEEDIHYGKHPHPQVDSPQRRHHRTSETYERLHERTHEIRPEEAANWPKKERPRVDSDHREGRPKSEYEGYAEAVEDWEPEDHQAGIKVAGDSDSDEKLDGPKHAGNKNENGLWADDKGDDGDDFLSGAWREMENELGLPHGGEGEALFSKEKHGFYHEDEQELWHQQDEYEKEQWRKRQLFQDELERQRKPRLRGRDIRKR